MESGNGSQSTFTATSTTAILAFKLRIAVPPYPFPNSLWSLMRPAGLQFGLWDFSVMTILFVPDSCILLINKPMMDIHFLGSTSTNEDELFSQRKPREQPNSQISSYETG
ncbi:hypothetical protein ECG_05936 [Echinococcus granulosus]|nr:hypothetical protein ECG_05936 [Echinococcus granulosus]